MDSKDGIFSATDTAKFAERQAVRVATAEDWHGQRRRWRIPVSPTEPHGGKRVASGITNDGHADASLRPVAVARAPDARHRLAAAAAGEFAQVRAPPSEPHRPAPARRVRPPER